MVQVINMEGCGLGDRGLAALACVLENAPNLTHFDLAWNTLGRKSVSALAYALSVSSKIVKIGLRHTGMSDKDGVFMCQALHAQDTWLAADFAGAPSVL